MSKSLDDFRKKILSDQKSKEIYDSLVSEFIIHTELVRARQESGLSPEGIAEGTGISREDIARLEGSNLDEKSQLNLIHLQKYIDFIGYEIEFRVTPRSK